MLNKRFLRWTIANRFRGRNGELLFFILIAILNTVPFISFQYFPSMDGPSHLANANIIRNMLFSGNDFLREFVRINPEPVPNWTGHALLAILMTFLPAFMAEKVLLTAMLLGMPFAFRSLMNAVSPRNLWLSYLIFPFSHSIFLIYGFYNFNISIIMLLLTLSYWVRSKKHDQKPLRFIYLALLLIITYFSHIVSFAILGILLFLEIFSDTIISLKDKKTGMRITLLRFARQTGLLLLSAAVPIFLAVWFIIGRHESSTFTSLSPSVLVKRFIELYPLVSLNGVAEFKSIRFLAILLGILLLTGILMNITLRREIRLNGSTLWMILSSLTGLLIYFIFPDTFGSGSYSSARIAFITLIMMILLISTLKIPGWILFLAGMISIGINYKHVSVLKQHLSYYSPLLKACSKAGNILDHNAQVLPINLTNHYFTGHFLDYAATGKPVIMVYNYECTFGYFPLVWNETRRPNYYIGDTLRPKTHCVKFDLRPGNTFRKVDYVLLLGKYDTTGDWFFRTLDRILLEDSHLVFQEDNCRMFRINP